MYNEADDYKMIDRAAGVAFSNLQKPVVPAWVNKDPVTGDTKYYPIPNPETFNGLSVKNWQYVMQLEEDARKMQGLALFLGGLLGIVYGYGLYHVSGWMDYSLGGIYDE